MSRAYRISVRESDRRVLKAGDAVGTCLGLLEVLPAEEMAVLLEQELTGLGFRKDGELLRRESNGVTATVDPKTGEVTVRAEVKAEVELSSIREGLAYDDLGPNAKNVDNKLREQAKQDLQRQADHQRNKLQREATQKLEGELCDLKPDLDRAVNRATAAALKKKAAQLGQIKEIHEDRETGSVTIKVEV